MATDSTAFCGIDVGTQGVRACVVDEAGAVVGAGSAPLTGQRGPLGRHEQDPQSWWAALVVAVRAAVAQAPRAHLVAVALDATSGTVLVEDRNGDPKGPALMYDDRRAEAQAARAQQVGAVLWSALGYRMQAPWGLPKALWLVERGAAGRGDRIVHQTDHRDRRLTATPVATDTSNALKTGADLRSARWPDDVFGELGLDVGLLPELVLPGAVLGTVGADAAAATGLPAGAQIRAGMTDGCAAQIAAGALRPGRWSSALGTTLVVKGSTTDLVRDPSGAVYCHRHPDGGWLPGGASSTGAGAIAAEFAAADLPGLTAAAARSPLPTALTYPLVGTGERFPFVAPQAFGFPTGAGRSDAERFAALCLGIAYIERLSYDVLGLLGADVTGTVSLTGGATRNTWWNQLRTDVLRRPTAVPASSEAAVGMAILAAAPQGGVTRTAERMVRVADRFEPDADRGAELAPGYARLVAELAKRGWLARRYADPVLAGNLADRRAG